MAEELQGSNDAGPLWLRIMTTPGVAVVAVIACAALVYFRA